MNCDHIQNCWDDARDGTLPADKRARFDEHLRACPACARLYERESEWLAMLGEHEPATVDRAFAAHIMNRLERPAARVGRAIRWAAAVALIGGIIAIALRPAPEAGQPPSVAEIQAQAADPVSVLVLEISGQINRHPGQLRQAFSDTASVISVNGLLRLLNEQSGESADDPRRG